jgi:hypothetical protein
MTTDNFCFYLQNSLIQTSQTGVQWYSDTSPFSIPWWHFAECRYAEWHYAGCHYGESCYVECCGAKVTDQKYDGIDILVCKKIIDLPKGEAEVELMLKKLLDGSSNY